tara:strand:- start:335 stop:589 length:255 start_codon:yes stop_codon:yes gene_type:complete
MNKFLTKILRSISILIWLFTFLLWISFGYPEYNPFKFGIPSLFGVFQIFFNYTILVVLAGIGYFFWNLAKPHEDKSNEGNIAKE